MQFKLVCKFLFIVGCLYVIADNLLFVYTKQIDGDWISLPQNRSNRSLTIEPPIWEKNISDGSLYLEKVAYETGKLGNILPVYGKPVGHTKLERKNCNVLFFGGSTTASIHIPQQVRWPNLVGKLLPRATTYNFGSGGQDSYEQIIKLLIVGPSLNPKYIAIMNVLNDLGHLIDGQYAPQKGAKNNELYYIPNSNNRGKNIIKNVFPFTYTRLRNFYDIKLHLQAQEKNIFMEGFDKSEREGGLGTKPVDLDNRTIKIFLEYYRKSLELFIMSAKTIGATPILITQPNRYEKEFLEISEGRLQDQDKPNSYISLEKSTKEKGLSVKQFIKAYSLFNQLVRDIAFERKILLVEAAKKFPSSVKTQYDAIHFNPEGSKLMAKLVASEFNKLNICNKPSTGD